MFLGREILRAGPLGKLGFLDKAAMRRRSEEAFRNLGVRIQDTTRAGRATCPAASARASRSRAR